MSLAIASAAGAPLPAASTAGSSSTGAPLLAELACSTFSRRSLRSRRRGRGACSSRSSGVSHSPIVVLTSRSMRVISSRWAGVTKVIARPVLPTRPVRPIRCT